MFICCALGLQILAVNCFEMEQYRILLYIFSDMITTCNIFYNLQLCFIGSVDIGSSESFFRGGELPTLIVQSTGHALHVFINGQLSGKLLVLVSSFDLKMLKK